MLHVSDLLHARRCRRLAYNTRKIPLAHENFYHLQSSYSSLWSKYLKIEKAPSGKVGDSNEQTRALLTRSKIVKNARFSYRDLRTKIPVLIQEEDGLVLIYPFLSAYPKESEATRIKIDQMILEKAGYSIKKIKSLYLNKDYVRKEELDLDELFVLGDFLFSRRNKMGKEIMQLLEEESIDLDREIEDMKALLSGPEPEAVRTRNCSQGRKCIYYDWCFEEEKNEPDDSILFLTTSQNKLKAYEEGIRHIKEIDPNLIEGFPLQYAQYRASQSGALFCDEMALRTWMDQIQYPISYLDFEWDTFPIPPYKGMQPFDVLCFQYSLHVEQKDGQLSHMDFFGTQDCRRAFIRSLLDNVPKEGSILVYNMEGAEKLRLIQLGRQFPEYAQELEQIYERMIDLSKPFELGIYYDNKMRGHYSLKNLLPVFHSDYSYEHLMIKDGMNAVFAYRNYEKSTVSEQNEIQNSIRTYCMMDTYAEYVIYHGLKERLDQLKSNLK